MKTQSFLTLALGALLAVSGTALVAGCGSRHQESPLPAAPPPTSGPVTSSGDMQSQTLTIPSQEPPVAATTPAPKSRMTATISGGSLTVTLNGRKVGDYPSDLKTDVTRYLKVGENRLEVAWTKTSIGEVKIEYALTATPSRYEDIANIFVSSTDTRKLGRKTATFNLPNSDGTLPAAETPTPFGADATRTTPSLSATPPPPKTIGEVSKSAGTLAPGETPVPSSMMPRPVPMRATATPVATATPETPNRDKGY